MRVINDDWSAKLHLSVLQLVLVHSHGVSETYKAWRFTYGHDVYFYSNVSIIWAYVFSYDAVLGILGLQDCGDFLPNNLELCQVTCLGTKNVV